MLCRKLFQKALFPVIISSTVFLSSPVFAQSVDHCRNGELMVMLGHGSNVQTLVGEASSEIRGLEVVKPICKSINVWLLSYSDSLEAHAAATRLEAFPDVVIAQCNHNDIKSRTIPNDPSFAQQWPLVNTGQTGGIADADIDADSAWDITTGGITSVGDTIVTAIIDGNFDLNHKDLDWWKNRDEIPSNGTDDDGNGYIDDFDGWNAYNSDGTAGSGSGTHGTHVSGIAGAIGNNNTGISGVNWQLKLMPVRGSSTTESIVLEAYGYVLTQRRRYNRTAGDSGAFVVSTNSSFGVDYGQPSAYPLWCAFYDSLGAEGVLSAAATANASWDIDVVGDVPTACSSPYMIAVTNTDKNDQKYTAGYGATTIDIGAPGTNVYSTIPFDSYQNMTGTSMSTPHIAGSVALVYAALCPEFFADFSGDPAGMAMAVRDYILQNGDPNTSLNGITVTGSRLNVYHAAAQAQAYINCGNSVYPLKQDAENNIPAIYPNPIIPGKTVIQYELEESRDVSVSIYNKLGQKIWTEKLGRRHAGINRHRINIDGLGSGLYLLKLETSTGMIGTKRVVILHS